MRFIVLTLAVLTVAACTFGGLQGEQTTNATTIASDVVPQATPVIGTNSVRNAKFSFTDGEFDGKEITKPEAEWKKELTAAQYHILREEGTEQPYSSSLNKNHSKGTFYCGACGLALFSSTAKFESGTGWPSFFEPIFAKNVTEKVDNKFAEERTEIECSRCHSHIGHVFDDGPEPTGLRYCMNGEALKFKAAK